MTAVIAAPHSREPLTRPSKVKRGRVQKCFHVIWIVLASLAAATTSSRRASAEEPKLYTQADYTSIQFSSSEVFILKLTFGPGDFRWTGDTDSLHAVYAQTVAVEGKPLIAIPGIAVVIYTRELALATGVQLGVSGGVLIVCAGTVTIDGKPVAPHIGQDGQPMFYDLDSSMVQEREGSSVQVASASWCGRVQTAIGGTWDLLDHAEFALNEDVLTRLSNADLRDSRSEAIHILSSAMLLQAPAADNPHYKEITDDQIKIGQIRDKYIRTLLRRTINIDLPGLVTQAIGVFYKGPSLDAELEPTEALLETQQVLGRDVIGWLTQDGDENLSLSLTASLTIDPFLASKAAERIKALGEHAGAIFSDWVFQPAALSPGVTDIKVSSTGNQVDLVFTIRRELASLVLFKLISEAGFPIQLNWTYTGDPNVKGRPLNVRLSLAKVKDPGVRTSGNVIRNTGDRPVSIGYFLTAEHKFVFFSPTKILGPGESLAASDGGSGPIQVPVEAVVLQGLSLDHIEDSFYIPSDAEIVARLSVTNLVAATVRPDYGGLERVQVQITFRITDSAGKVADYKGPSINLAPFGAQGSIVERSFIKPRAGKLDVLVTGTAFYENGQISLRQSRSPSLAVKITDDSLATPDGKQ
jgi:hypothetical protein